MGLRLYAPAFGGPSNGTVRGRVAEEGRVIGRRLPGAVCASWMACPLTAPAVCGRCRICGSLWLRVSCRGFCMTAPADCGLARTLGLSLSGRRSGGKSPKHECEPRGTKPLAFSARKLLEPSLYIILFRASSISRMPAGLIDPGMTRTAGDARPSATASMAVDGGTILEEST